MPKELIEELSYFESCKVLHAKDQEFHTWVIDMSDRNGKFISTITWCEGDVSYNQCNFTGDAYVALESLFGEGLA